MKKIIAVLITVILLISVSPLQSLAFTVKLPTVESVKFLDDVAISRKDIEDYKASIDEMIDEIITDYSDWFEEDIDMDYILEMLDVEAVEELYDYSLGNYDYKLEATLSDGSVHEVDLYYGNSEIDRYTSVLVWAEVKYTDYLAAVEADSDVIPVTVHCEVFSSISGIGKSSEFTVEKDFVNCFIKQIAPKGTLKNTYYEDAYIPYLEGESFVVTYADGSKKTYKAKFDPEAGEYMLNGEPLISFADEDKAFLWYFDAYYEYECTPVESPYKSIEITDYTLTETEGLTSVTVEITKKNGSVDTVVADTGACLDEGELYPYFDVIAHYDTYSIYIYSDEIADWESRNPVITGMEISVAMGEIYSKGVEVEYYGAPEAEKDIMTILEDVVAFILTRFFDIFSFLFSSNEVM